VSKQSEGAAVNGTAAPSAPAGGSSALRESDIDPETWQLSRVGVYMTADHRYYVNGDGPYPSVTTALDVLHKPALQYWYAQQTATAAVMHLPELIGKSVEDAVELIMQSPGAPTRQRDRAAKLGTSVHLLAELIALGGPEPAAKGFEISPEQLPYAEAFRGFLGRYSGSSIVSSEKAVFSRTDGYAGTYDLLMLIEGELWLIDIKTSKQGTYPEYGLQLAAYGHAEYIVLPNDPTLYPMPEVKRYGILHLRPDAYPGPLSEGWRLIEYPVMDRDYVAFLAALDIWQWKAEGRFSKKQLVTTT